MTETKDKFNWNNLAEKGDDYGDINTKLTALESYYCKLEKEKVYDQDNEFTKEFEQILEIDIAQTFESSSLTQKDITLLKNKFLARIKTTLNFVVLKQGYAQITFDQYPLYKFFEAFNNFVDEVEFKVSKEHIKIVISDPSRIAVIKVTFCNDSYQFLKEGKLGINIETLRDLLKCDSKDESTVTLLFTEEMIEMSITSTKRKRTIVRKLNAIDFEIQEMPIDTLNAINYPFEFQMTKDDFLDLTKNIGRYSEIVGIQTKPDVVIFSESSDKGSAEIDYKKSNLPSLKFFKDALHLDSELENERIADEKIFALKECLGYYSLTYLKLIKEFCNVVNTKDKITFSLKSNHPLKSLMTFKKLSNAQLFYYLAPRKELDEDDDEFEPTEIEVEDLEIEFEPTDEEQD